MANKQYDTTAQFERKLKKLIADNAHLENLIFDTIDLFLENRAAPVLRDHALKGSQHGLRSFSVAPNIRIIYRELEDLYIFQNIGTHKEVYIY